VAAGFGAQQGDSVSLATFSMPLTSAWWPRREVCGHIVRRRSLEGAVARRGW
jgi:hypothetical protein